MIDLFRKQFQECQSLLWPLETRHHAYLTLGHLRKDNVPRISQYQAIQRLKRAKIPIVKTHELPGFNELGEENSDFVQCLTTKGRYFYIVRDPREVMTSLHLGLQSHDLNARCSFSEFIRQQPEGISWLRKWVNHVRSWMQVPEINVIKYENIIENPNQYITQFGKQLSVNPLYRQPLLPVKKAPINRLEDYYLRITRQYESTSIDSKYSRNKKHWRELMNKEDRILFHHESDNLLTDLGYEIDDSWIGVQ